MNIVEMYDHCKYVYNQNLRASDNWEKGYEYIGLRFEDKERQINEICEYSRNNVEREDEREFPEYGTDEYFEMEELEGTSAWNMAEDETYRIGRFENRNDECARHFETYHCYIVAGNKLGNTSNTITDVNEIVIKDAKVIDKIF